MVGDSTEPTADFERPDLQVGKIGLRNWQQLAGQSPGVATHYFSLDYE
jgi:hypothetical protein